MKITLYTHPLAPVAPQVFDAPSIGEWLLTHYGSTPTVRVQVFAGQPSADTEITGNLAALLANDAPEYVVLQSPAGVEWLVYAAIIAAVVTVATILLIPKPVMPGNVNRTQQSPNNALGARENKVRLLERIEDIYGTVNAIPSLMMPTYIKYINNQKYEYGYYSVGRGYYELRSISDADTLIADIPGAAASVYDPFTSPNSGIAPVQQIGSAIIDPVLTVKRAIEVDGITLKARNQIQLPNFAGYTFTAAPGGDSITQTAPQPNFNAIAEVGDSIVVGAGTVYTPTATGSATADAATSQFSDPASSGLFSPFIGAATVTVSGFAAPGNNGTFTIASANANQLVLSGATLTDETATGSFSSPSTTYDGVYTVAAVSDGSVTLTTSTFARSSSAISANVQIAEKSEYSAWVTLPSTTRTEVWVNVTAPNGMFRDKGGKSITGVNFAIEIERLTLLLVPTGVVQTVNSSLNGLTSDERGDTVEAVTPWTGPARVRMRRTSDYDYTFAGIIQDEIKWADLLSVSPVDKLHFGNKTTIHTVTQANSRATAVKSRQLNCIASRLLPTYNGSTYSAVLDADGRLVSGTLAATSKLSDIIAAVSADPRIGAQNLATQIDMPQIYAVQQQLDAWAPEAGQFNYTFDSDNTSFEETLVMIANAGFCIAYRQNGKVRLAFDRAQANSTALFTHRNKKPNAETITRKFASDAEYDGVEFVYSDPDSKQSETITLPLNGSYTKVKKSEIPGIRSFAQAWLRANREFYKLVGQRETLETTTTLDGRNLLPNARISVVDNTRFKAFDGEVVGQTGLEITLSRDVTFTPAQPHSVVLMRRDGSLQSIPATAGSAPNKVVLQALPSEAITTQYGADGIRTIFSFAADSARAAQAWLVQELDTSDPQYVTVRAVNYADGYYQADNLAIPLKATVIN